MKHIQYGVRHICTENGVDTKLFPVEQWFETDEMGKETAMEQVKSYTSLNEKCIKETKPVRHDISLISREVGDIIIEGDLSWYDNGKQWEENVSYLALSNEEHDMKDIQSFFNTFLNHKVRIKIEYLD